MNRKAGIIESIIMFFLLIVIGLGIYYIYENIPRESVKLNASTIQEPIIENNISSKQFYERMRYSDRVINYYISESCTQNKFHLMQEALDILESKTILVFNLVSKENAVLNILCLDLAPEEENKNYFVAGEGGPSRVLNSTLYSIILEGKIALYRDGTCDNANVAIHELLHALGFDHNNNPKSVLYPTLKCDQKIDEEIIESINKLYRVDSRPDLVFKEVNATKRGKYLDFHMEVLNQGLKSTDGVNVGLYADDVFVESFDLKAISIGSKKIIDVANLKVPLKATRIRFEIDYEYVITEIYEDNNEIELNTF